MNNRSRAWLSRLGVFAAAAILLSACSLSSKDDSATPTSVSSPTVAADQESATSAGSPTVAAFAGISATPSPVGSPIVAADADLTRSCWTESQRIANEGDPSVAQQWSAPPAMAIDPEKTYAAEIKTNYGTI